MLLKNLQLTNFRNYSQKEFSFSAGVTVIVGANASGKTNLLEAIYLLSTGRSFRAGVEREMIGYGEEVGRVEGTVIQKTENRKQRTEEENSDALFSEARLPSSVLSSLELEVVLTPGSVLGKRASYKRLLVNGVGKRLLDFVGNLPAVLFWPEDLELVTDSPSLRRKYLDNVLFLVDREYRRASLAYEKALRVRNKILQGLKNAQNDYAAVHQVLAREGEMDYWEKVLVEKGRVITGKREEYIEFLNNRLRQRVTVTKPVSVTKLGYVKKDTNNVTVLRNETPGGVSHCGGHRNPNQITNNEFQFKIEYKKSEISYERLREYQAREAAAGMTLVGPHRDDFVISLKAPSLIGGSPKRRQGSQPHRRVAEEATRLKDKELSVYGSRGEQRLGVLWLKLGEMEFVAEKLGARPILLLDDIFSELDEEHRRLVMNIIPKQQTIITTTDLKVIEKGFLKEGEVIKIG